MNDLICKNKLPKEKLVIFAHWLNGDTTVNISTNSKIAVLHVLTNIDSITGVVGLSILSVEKMSFGGWYFDSSRGPSFDFCKHFTEDNLMEVEWVTDEDKDENEDNTLIIRRV